jgi:2'-5' RNA ligase
MDTNNLLTMAREGRSLWIGLFERGVTDPDGEHCTLLFCGKDRDGDAVKAALHAVYELQDRAGTYWAAALRCRAGGLARFRGNATEGDPIVILLQDARLRQMKEELDLRMRQRGWIGRASDFDYTPHVTIGRVPREEVYHASPVGDLKTYIFEHVGVVCGDAMLRFALERPTL